MFAMAENAPIITCVCTGNICRSPMAAKLLQHALSAENKPWRSVQVNSAGVSAARGEKASLNAVKALKKVGLDLSDHRSQQITKELIEKSLVIFCMTESHRLILQNYFPSLKTPIRLFREQIPDPAEQQIPDPFGTNLAVYENCRDSIVEAIPFIIKYLKEYYKL